jgi:hypothetical protein
MNHKLSSCQTKDDNKPSDPIGLLIDSTVNKSSRHTGLGPVSESASHWIPRQVRNDIIIGTFFE